MCYETRARRAGASSNLQLRERGARAEPRLGGGHWGMKEKKKNLDTFFSTKGRSIWPGSHLNLPSWAPQVSQVSAPPTPKTGVVLGLLIMNF